MTREEQIHYWKDSSDDDSRFMERLLALGDYSWALFIGHLCLEKILKGHYVKTSEQDQRGERMDQKQALAVARRYLDVVNHADWKVVEAFLFGSQANGTAKSDSDLDIALVLDSQENGVLLQWEMMKLRHAVDIMIEPHPISVQEWNEGTPFTEEIKRTGIRIA